MERFFFSLGALLAGLAVAAGAYGAHGATAVYGEDQLLWIDKAARYQMYHSLALLAVASALGRWQRQAGLFKISGWLFLLGILFFSGSLYVMVFSEVNPGYVTPLGGFCFILGWFILGVAAWRCEAVNE